MRTRLQSSDCDGRINRAIQWILLTLLWITGCSQEDQRQSNNNESISYLLRLLLCHVYLRFWRRSIFPKYDYSSNDPIKRSFFVPEVEYTIEHPASQEQLEHEGEQELLLGAMRSSGEFLFIRMVRASQRQAQLHIVLKDGNGRTFTSIEGTNGHLPLDISHGSKFQAGGLRMLCIEPMRRWRIAFNGMMLHKEANEPMYVRFVFIWSVHTDVFDWHKHIPSHSLIKQCLNAEQKLSQTISAIELYQEHLNGFEQTGYLVGTLQVGGPSLPQRTSDDEQQQTNVEPEQELYLRGNFVRQRHYGMASGGAPRLSGFTHSFVYSAKGQLLQLSGLKFANSERGFVFGSFVGTSTFKDPIESVLDETGKEADIHEAFTSPLLKVKTFELSHEVLRSEGEVIYSSKSFLGWNNELRISTFDAMIDGYKAFGITLQGVTVGIANDELIKPPLNILDSYAPSSHAPYVVSLQDPRCKEPNLTGGKGSSLAVLMELSSMDLSAYQTTKDNIDIKFDVPAGIVVTTAAFARFMQSPAMATVKHDLNKVLATSSIEEVKNITNDCVQRVSTESIPSCVAKEILEQLRNMFPDLSSKRFAVRSSCAGEDSEDMSAAGQMETFLGIKGKNEILASVAKCWASQFSHVAVGYKRRYGQELVSDMAVVIMEMVPADCAGVMFTCDPLTGDPSTIYITSNFGLGESVVSALADPDTVRVSRDISGNLKVSEVALGKKDVKVVMDEGGGTRHETISAEKSSIGSAQATMLAHVGNVIERCYGDWRDIEWAFAGETLYALQARPVTFMDRPSDFEIASELDCGAPAENACYSKANVGEVLQGSSSPLGIDILMKVNINAMINSKIRSARGRRFAYNPYGSKMFRISRQHFFLDISEFFRFVPDGSDVKSIESLMLNICGRIVDDPEIYNDVGDPSDLPIAYSSCERHWESIEAKWLPNLKLRLFRWIMCRSARFPTSSMSINELYDGLLKTLVRVADYSLSPHVAASIGSSLWSSDIVAFLSANTDESMETIYGDMSKLLSSADNVVSCDAPRALERLVSVIYEEIGMENFVNASKAEALAMLKDQNAYPKSYALFTSFLDDHGHRGYNEFDVYQRTWGINEEPVIGTLQSMMRNNLHENPTAKVHESVWTAMKSIHCKLTFWQQLRLAGIVYLTRKAVGNRENSKSLAIWGNHVCRQWCWALASEMHKQGRLPDKDLFFFCTLHEIFKLRKERDPTVIARAHHRKRVYPELVALHFPEYSRGIARPIVEEPPTFEDGVVKISGFPISKGRIQAKARVITTIDDAPSIQRGEILITYATDIGWSPYFPLLSGIATELGGLMSHGAVVAREYGLPCVVGVFGARQAFRTGDTVLLDGSNGFILRVEEAGQNSVQAVP